MTLCFYSTVAIADLSVRRTVCSGRDIRALNNCLEYLGSENDELKKEMNEIKNNFWWLQKHVEQLEDELEILRAKKIKSKK